MKTLLQKPWRLLLPLVLLLLLGSLLLIPGVRWPVYGWLKGEAFYQGMPTSWWVQEIEETYFRITDNAAPKVKRGVVKIWYRASCLPLSERIDGWMQGRQPQLCPDDALLNGDLAEQSVLQQLLGNHSARVRRVAVCGMQERYFRLIEDCPLGETDEKKAITAALLQATLDRDKNVRTDASIFLTLLANACPCRQE